MGLEWLEGVSTPDLLTLYTALRNAYLACARWLPGGYVTQYEWDRLAEVDTVLQQRGISMGGK